MQNRRKRVGKCSSGLWWRWVNKRRSKVESKNEDDSMRVAAIKKKKEKEREQGPEIVEKMEARERKLNQVLNWPLSSPNNNGPIFIFPLLAPSLATRLTFLLPSFINHMPHFYHPLISSSQFILPFPFYNYYIHASFLIPSQFILPSSFFKSPYPPPFSFSLLISKIPLYMHLPLIHVPPKFSHLYKLRIYITVLVLWILCTLYKFAVYSLNSNIGFLYSSVQDNSYILHFFFILYG